MVPDNIKFTEGGGTYALCKGLQEKHGTVLFYSPVPCRDGTNEEFRVGGRVRDRQLGLAELATDKLMDGKLLQTNPLITSD